MKVVLIPLAIRSHYSLMRGTASPREICSTARRMGYDRLALTDTDNLYGLWPFLDASRAQGITPIVGAEITEPGSRRRAVALVRTAEGYGNLCRLVTRRHCDPGFSLETAVTALAGGLILLTAHPSLLAAWRDSVARLYAALHRRPGPASRPVRETARRLGIPLAATPSSFFLNPEDVHKHRLLRAVDCNTTMSRLPVGETAPADAWFAPPEEYARRFAACPEAVAATREIAEAIEFSGPEFGIVMPPWNDPTGRTAEDALRTAAYEGARDRYGAPLPEAVTRRLEYELDVIAKMGFSAYFLVVRDIVATSPRTCGRGSGAASLVAYALRITNVCPIKHHLYFERFLNPGRNDPPDIDVDFAWDERDQVLNTVLKKYKGHAAMVANHVIVQPRMAVREVAKVYGMPEGDIRRVTRRLPWSLRCHESRDLTVRIPSLPECRALHLDDPWPEILARAQQIIGAPRHLSVHPGGVIITPKPVDGYVPLEFAPKGVPVIQWEKDAAEDAGLVKIDLLGNRSLGVIRDAVADLRENGVDFDESRWEPEDDPATQETMARGRTMGCFYVESPAMRQLQKKSGKGDFEHIVIHTSIIRPAANDCIREYLGRLRGKPWQPMHPLMTGVLDDTYGIMVYQEDVSKTAIHLAGFSHAEADRLRKIMSKKDNEQRLRDYREKFFHGARRNGVPADTVETAWGMILSFSGYSFCKPHSASYTRVSYQAAYLKTHFPAEFMAAVISNQGGFYDTSAYVSEARRMGLTVLPPDVNKSDVRWLGKGRTLRAGLLSIKDLSAATRERMVRERQTCPFAGVRDFLNRARPTEPEARALIRCGAMDGVSPNANRAAMMWALAAWLKTRQPKRENRRLFEDEDDMPPLPPETPLDRYRREYSVLGFLCDRHPMTLLADRLKSAGHVKAADLKRHVGRRVTVAGWLITGKAVRTKHGDRMEFMTFEDETGLVEATFFPQAYDRCCHLLDGQGPYLISGKVESDCGAVSLTAEGMVRLR